MEVVMKSFNFSVLDKRMSKIKKENIIVTRAVD
jgi:hypothetical protein